MLPARAGRAGFSAAGQQACRLLAARGPIGALAGQGSHLGTDRAGAAHEAFPARWEGVVAGGEPPERVAAETAPAGDGVAGEEEESAPPERRRAAPFCL